MNKEPKDFEFLARGLLDHIMQHLRKTIINDRLCLEFDDKAQLTTEYYLLDAFNDGYDAALTAQIPREVKHD